MDILTRVNFDQKYAKIQQNVNYATISLTFGAKQSFQMQISLHWFTVKLRYSGHPL